MTMIAGSMPALLEPGLHKLFGLSYNEQPMLANSVFNVRSSGRGYEIVQEMYGLGLATVKAEAAAIDMQDMGQGRKKVFQHTVYGTGFSISEEAVDDNMYMEVATARTKQLARALMHCRETVAFNILNRAFNSSYTGLDGKELLATDHTHATGETFANETTAASLSEAALEDLLILIDKAKDAKNLNVLISPNKLIVPPDLKFEAHRIMKSVGERGVFNSPNALSAVGGISSDVIVSPFLSSTSAYFLTTNVDDGLILFERKAPEFKQEPVIRNGVVEFTGKHRFSVGWANPLGLYGNAGA